MNGLIMWVALSAAAATPPATVCGDARVSFVGEAAARWSGLVGQACALIDGVVDRDPEAAVILRGAPDRLWVEVMLPDGRRARRGARDVAGLSRALRSLLTLPPTAPRVEVEVEVAAPTLPSLAQRPHRALVAQPSAAWALGWHLGASMDGRFAGRHAQLSVGPRVFAEVAVNTWRVGLEMRSELAEWSGERRLPLDALGWGLNAARRFEPGFATLDVGVAPRVRLENHRGASDRAQAELRMGAFTRAIFADGVLRPFVGVDMEVSPTRLRDGGLLDADGQAEPAWSVGVGAGLSWSL